MKNSKSGFAIPAVYFIVVGLLLAGGYVVKETGSLFHSQNQKQKTEVKAVLVDNSAALTAEKSAQEAAAAAAKAGADAAVARATRNDLTYGYVAATGDALSHESNPDIHVRVAILMNERAKASLDPASAKIVDEFADMVVDLESDNAALVAKGQAADTSFQATVADARSKQGAAEALAVQKGAAASAAQLQASTLLQKSVADGQKLVNWASQYASLWSRFKHFVLAAGIFGALLLAALYLVPGLAAIFPKLAGFAKKVGAVVAPLLTKLHNDEKAALTAVIADFHAKAAVAAPVQAVAAPAGTVLAAIPTPPAPPAA